jgi:hypothetical protein
MSGGWQHAGPWLQHQLGTDLQQIVGQPADRASLIVNLIRPVFSDRVDWSAAEALIRKELKRAADSGNSGCG